MMINQFNPTNFNSLCDTLASKHHYFKKIIDAHGHPPLWNRKPTFATLVNIILEQQVSLASAKAAFQKLQKHIGLITPKKISTLSDAELKACYFSRQKIIYVRHLAESFQNKNIQLKKLNLLSNDEIRIELKKVKGIGDWSVDVYLMMCLNRADLFPLNDIALIKSIKEIMQFENHPTKEKLIALTNSWKPYRTVAAYLCWHAYLRKRNINV
ncbi:MAG: DNA-3-methyladenine glycosylase 2 family protein [Bacteroidia bacterium]